MKPCIYISSKIRENFREVVDTARQHQVGIEIKDFIKSRVLDKPLKPVLKEYKNFLDGFEGKLALHGAFQDLNPVSGDSKIRDLTVYRYKQSLEIAQTLGVKTIVFHSGFQPFGESTKNVIEMFIRKSVKFWKDFIDDFEKAGVTAVIENTTEKTPHIILEIINKVNSKNLKACIDTGHVNVISHMSVEDWISEFGHNLAYMHIHNNSGVFDRHDSLLKGTVDFKRVFEALDENNVKPGLSIEIPDYEPAMESLNFVKRELKIS